MKDSGEGSVESTFEPSRRVPSSGRVHDMFSRCLGVRGPRSLQDHWSSCTLDRVVGDVSSLEADPDGVFVVKTPSAFFTYIPA